jgi:hypothetical protein
VVGGKDPEAIRRNLASGMVDPRAWRSLGRRSDGGGGRGAVVGTGVEGEKVSPCSPPHALSYFWKLSGPNSLVLTSEFLADRSLWGANPGVSGPPRPYHNLCGKDMSFE